MDKTLETATKKSSRIAVNLIGDDIAVVDSITAKLADTHGKLPITAVIRMALRHFDKHLV